MRTAYVLMYMQDSVGSDGKKSQTLTPYAVFDNSITAEKMKRPGDQVVSVPYFEDTEQNLADAVERYKNYEVPLNTWTPKNVWCSEGSTLAEQPSPIRAKVTCNKTVDEHTWRDRSD